MKNDLQEIASLKVRLIGFLFVAVGSWLLFANLLESICEFDPTYLLFYIYSQMLRPLLAILIGGLFMGTSRRLSRWLTRKL